MQNQQFCCKRGKSIQIRVSFQKAKRTFFHRIKSCFVIRDKKKDFSTVLSKRDVANAPGLNPAENIRDQNEVTNQRERAERNKAIEFSENAEEHVHLKKNSKQTKKKS